MTQEDRGSMFMDEKEKNDLPKEDISKSYNSIFDENTADYTSENMNRDYLNHIYGEDMESLNKQVLMTRTQYYEKVQDINTTFEENKKLPKTILIVSLVILCVFIGVAISFYAQGLRFYDLFFENMSDIKSVNNGEINGYSTSTLKGMWQIFGLSGMAGSLFLLVGAIQFYFLGVGNIRHIKNLKKNKDKALQTLEDMKKENMLMGTYDASK